MYNTPASSLRYIKPEGKPKTAWLVAPPCVGSTWASLLLTELLEWRTFWPAPKHNWRRPQDVTISPALDKIRGNLFLQHTHTMWNANTRAFCKALDPKVIVMHRELADNAVSIRDHLLKLDTGLPNVWVTDSFKSLNPELALTHVIHYALPWTINFYASWMAAQQQKIKVHYLDYHDLKSNPGAALGRLLAFLGESRSADEIAQAITKAADPNRTRFNVAQEGRGLATMTIAQVAALKGLLGSFHDSETRDSLTKVTPNFNATSKPDPIEPHDARRRKSVEENVHPAEAGQAARHQNRPTGRLRRHGSGPTRAAKGSQ
jgi:hypothetical protein